MKYKNGEQWNIGEKMEYAGDQYKNCNEIIS
jgi:hypothetical protein